MKQVRVFFYYFFPPCMGYLTGIFQQFTGIERSFVQWERRWDNSLTFLVPCREVDTLSSEQLDFGKISVWFLKQVYLQIIPT